MTLSPLKGAIVVEEKIINLSKNICEIICGFLELMSLDQQINMCAH